MFFCAEFIEIVILKYWPQHIKAKIDDTGDKDNEPRKVKIPAYWEMSASDLKKIADKDGLGREVKLKQDIIVELVELSRNYMRAGGNWQEKKL